MIHSILVGAVFVAMVLIPCLIARFSIAVDQEAASDIDVMDEGFI